MPKEGRRPEPSIPAEVTGKELDRTVWQQLRTLSVENADGVAKHLVMVAALLEADDIRGALAHAETAARRAGRVPAAHEALGMVYYRAGDFGQALKEFRTVRRLSGSSHLLPLMVDCERGLGRPERALELAQSPDAQTLRAAEQVELLIVTSGIRRDLGQTEAALLTLDVGALHGPVKPWSSRLYYAYADTLLELGRVDEAREWFAKAAEHDHELETDASERLDEIDGISVDFGGEVFSEAEFGEAGGGDVLDPDAAEDSGADLDSDDVDDSDSDTDTDTDEVDDTDVHELDAADLDVDDDIEAEVDAILDGTLDPGDPLGGHDPQAS